MRLLGDLGRRRLAGADRPDRLVGDDEVVLGLEHPHLPAEDVLGLARLALGLGLADARDDGQARVQRCTRSPRDAFVRLAEELAALRVADDGAVHAQLAEHLRRDLAGEGALRLPVHVLGGNGDVRSCQDLHRHGQRREGRTDGDVNAFEVGLVPSQLDAELGRLDRAFEHLPVACDEHAMPPG